MVKRQTVWLSTMMVLSLMLIGYYTMNNQSSTTSTTPTDSSISTSVQDGTTSSGTGTDTKSGSSGSGQTTSSTTSTSSSDWFTNAKLTVNNQMSQQMGRLQSQMANNNSSPDQIAQASAQLKQLMSLNAGIDNASQAIKADGFKNAVIIPDQKLQTFTVYVETNNLQQDDALKVMNIASQQLDTSMLNLSVKAHS